MQCKCWSCCRITKAKHVSKITSSFPGPWKCIPLAFAVLSDLMPPALLIFMCLLQEQFCLQPYREPECTVFQWVAFPTLPRKGWQMWLWTSNTNWLVPNGYHFMASLKAGYKMQSNHNSELVCTDIPKAVLKGTWFWPYSFKMPLRQPFLFGFNFALTSASLLC